MSNNKNKQIKFLYIPPEINNNQAENLPINNNLNNQNIHHIYLPNNQFNNNFLGPNNFNQKKNIFQTENSSFQFQQQINFNNFQGNEQKIDENLNILNNTLPQQNNINNYNKNAYNHQNLEKKIFKDNNNNNQNNPQFNNFFINNDLNNYQEKVTNKDFHNHINNIKNILNINNEFNLNNININNINIDQENINDLNNNKFNGNQLFESLISDSDSSSNEKDNNNNNQNIINEKDINKNNINNNNNEHIMHNVNDNIFINHQLNNNNNFQNNINDNFNNNLGMNMNNIFKSNMLDQNQNFQNIPNNKEPKNMNVNFQFNQNIQIPNNNILENNIINVQNNNFQNNIIGNNPQFNNNPLNMENNNKDVKPNEPNNPNKVSFSRYTKATKTGLVNLGDTSYLNAILQILGSFKIIASYFIKPKNIKKITDSINNNNNEMPLSYVVYRLIYHLYPYPENDQGESYKPESFLYTLSNLNIVYKSNKRRNPNDLINFILETLREELNTLKNNNQKLNPDIYNKNNVIQCGQKNFKKSNNSVISDLFNWFEIKEINCTQCKKKFYKFNTFIIFELDILKTYNSKKKFISIKDCIYYYYLSKKNISYCDTCKKNTNVYINSKIFCPSNFFIFSLDRKDLNQSYIKIPFFVEDKLNLTNFIDNNKVPSNYQLMGIVSFYKKEQKYISFCLSPVDNQWYLYNDEKIQQIQIDSILNCHNNNSNMQYIPCILIYKSLNI